MPLIDVKDTLTELCKYCIHGNYTHCEDRCVEFRNISKLPTIEVPQWIPVTERLPEPFVSVLVQMPGERPFPTVREGFITKDGIWHSALYNREPDEVTHWMPLPRPPEDGGAENA